MTAHARVAIGFVDRLCNTPVPPGHTARATAPGDLSLHGKPYELAQAVPGDAAQRFFQIKIAAVDRRPAARAAGCPAAAAT